MYILFRQKGWTPMQFYNMAPAEKRIAKVFLRQEMEEREEEARRLEEAAG